LKNWPNTITKKKLGIITHTQLDYNRTNINADLGVRFMFCTPQRLFAWSNQESDGRCMWHVWETGDMCSLLVGRPEGMKWLGTDGRITAKWISQEMGWGDTDWMNVVRDTDRWLALVNVVMNMQVSPCGCWATKNYSRLPDIFPAQASQYTWVDPKVFRLTL